MATTSFQKEFIVNDRDVANCLMRDLESGSSTVRYVKKNAEVDKIKVARVLARLGRHVSQSRKERV